MRIAIIGTGIAGHAAILALAGDGNFPQISVYERNARPGGHSATVDVDWDGQKIAVDTGFIVYNTLNYPNLTAMFDWLGVETKASDMSFSVSSEKGAFEWCGRDGQSGKSVFAGLFAQKSNMLSPGFLWMLREVLRFQKTALSDLANNAIGSGSLGEYLARYRFSQRLKQDYLIPMGAAIWSTSASAMMDFPAHSFIEFFDNHRLLQWQRPQWRTVAGGSRAYVNKIMPFYAHDFRANTPVVNVTRTAAGVVVRDASGHNDTFDEVIIAAHAPQALAMLSDADDEERSVLSAIRTAPNDVFLHRDPSLMPRRKAAWAAWNFLREGDAGDKKVAVTYWMNMLQGIDPACPLFVTLNPPREPDPALTFGCFSYDHPQFDGPARVAQQRLPSIQGRRNTWFCGAWAGHGFHEDGLVSGLGVAKALGARAPWQDALMASERLAAE